MLEQNRADMGKKAAKLGLRNCRGLSMALNSPPRDLHPQLRAPKATKTRSRRQPNGFLEGAVHSQFGQPSPIDLGSQPRPRGV